MADAFKYFTVGFSCDDFSIGTMTTIVPNGKTDPVTGKVSDAVTIIGYVSVKNQPKQTFGGVGVLLGCANSPATLRRYYAVLTGVKSQAADLDNNAYSAGAICRDPIAVSGFNFSGVTSALSAIIDSGTLIPASSIVFVLPALLDAWSRKGY